MFGKLAPVSNYFADTVNQNPFLPWKATETFELRLISATMRDFSM